MAKITDEQILAAVLTSPTNEEAAKALGFTPRHLYTRMKADGFQKLYHDAQKDIYKSALDLVTANLCNAVSTITSVMNNTEITPQVRLNASEMLIRCATRLPAAAKEKEEQDFYGALWR